MVIYHFQPVRAANSDYTRCPIPKESQTHCLPPASAENGQLRIWSIRCLRKKLITLVDLLKWVLQLKVITVILTEKINEICNITQESQELLYTCVTFIVSSNMIDICVIHDVPIPELIEYAVARSQNSRCLWV